MEASNTDSETLSTSNEANVTRQGISIPPTVSLLWRLGALMATVMTPPRAMIYEIIFESSLGK